MERIDFSNKQEMTTVPRMPFTIKEKVVVQSDTH